MAALVTALEGFALMGIRIPIAEADAALLVGSAAIGGMLCGLETTAKVAFILIEIAATLVGFFLRIAKAHPPHFPGAINAIGTSIFQSAAVNFGLLVSDPFA